MTLTPLLSPFPRLLKPPTPPCSTGFTCVCDACAKGKWVATAALSSNDTHLAPPPAPPPVPPVIVSTLLQAQSSAIAAIAHTMAQVRMPHYVPAYSYSFYTATMKTYFEQFQSVVRQIETS